MKTLYMFKGLPASGKSTRAKEMLVEFGTGNAKIVNKDLLRLMLDNGKWSGPNERFVLSIRDHIICAALEDGKHVLVDDTNLAPRHEERLQQLAREHGANFEVVDFTGVSVDQCIERDRQRPNFVGEQTIRRMYNDFLRRPALPPPLDAALPSAVIVDIDGTLAVMNGRGPFEWERVFEDMARDAVISVVRAYTISNGYERIFVSGRDECCRAETVRWLSERAGFQMMGAILLMRPSGDCRKDSVVKLELYEQHILGKYNIRAIFDDRPQVIREWYALGFGDRIFNVGDGTEF